MNETFLIQVGKGAKGAYRTRYSFTDQNRAIMYYSAINIGNGYKKRLAVKGTKRARVLCSARS